MQVRKTTGSCQTQELIRSQAEWRREPGKQFADKAVVKMGFSEEVPPEVHNLLNTCEAHRCKVSQ